GGAPPLAKGALAHDHDRHSAWPARRGSRREHARSDEPGLAGLIATLSAVVTDGQPASESTIQTTAAMAIAAAVNQPIAFGSGPFVRPPITLRSLAISMIRTSNGGARKPLITAVQNRASMGLMPRKLTSTPTP